MSDREQCCQCKHLSSPIVSHTKNSIGQEVRLTQYICNYPVPYWALPPSIVIPHNWISCPTFKAKKEGEEE